MKSTRDIKRKIRLIQNVQKLTHTMQWVSASKVHQAKKRMLASRPYAEKILRVIHHLANARMEYSHPFLEPRDVKRVGVIVVTSDHGLCGALNLGLFRVVLEELRQCASRGIEGDLCVTGDKGSAFFGQQGFPLIAKSVRVRDHVQTVHDVIGIVKVMLDHYHANRIQSLVLCFNEFTSMLTQTPRLMPLLPILATPIALRAHRWDYVYEPHPEGLLDTLLNRYIESQVYQGIVENVACEHAARMLAMQNATQSAKKLVEQSKLLYHKTRQAEITNELAEVVGGAGG